MKTFLGYLLLALAASDALAWRCNNWIIGPGQSLYEVGEKCGEPQSVGHRIDWRVLTTLQQQCQNITEPVYLPAPTASESGKGGPQRPQQSAVTYQTRTVCTSVPVSFTVPVEVEEWYFDDVSVPKALYFENGRLTWIKPLWNLRHH